MDYVQKLMDYLMVRDSLRSFSLDRFMLWSHASFHLLMKQWLSDSKKVKLQLVIFSKHALASRAVIDVL